MVLQISMNVRCQDNYIIMMNMYAQCASKNYDEYALGSVQV